MTMRHTNVQARAREIHDRNGHPVGYDGPCWGPTREEREQAKRELMGETDG
jgi:hypothetical protein